MTIPKLVPNIRVAPRYGFIPEFGSMEFYRTNDLLKGKKRPFFKDRTLPGAYQTMAIIEKNEDKIILRMVTESFLNKKNVFLQDYEILLSRDQSQKKCERFTEGQKSFVPILKCHFPCFQKVVNTLLP